MQVVDNIKIMSKISSQTAKTHSSAHPSRGFGWHGKATECKPTLRFPGFKGAWEEKRLGDFLIHQSREVPKPLSTYKALGLRSHFKGTFQKLDSDPKKIAMEKLFLVRENDFLVNITFAWEGALAIAKKEDDGGLVSHRFPTFIFNQKITNANYFRYVFPTKRMKYILGNISPGGAGRNRVLNKGDLLKIKVHLPSLPEQQKIADFLGSVDSWIENLRMQKSAFESYKKGIMQNIFSQEIRFKPDLRSRGEAGDDNGKEFPKWEENRLGDCLDYEQPTEYIVHDAEYDNSYKTPVLTAGKGFILGYSNETDNVFRKGLPVIIFDDFTTTSQFVDFPFKVKSSAMKILKAKENVDIRFLYAAIQQIKYEIGGHGRHWISKYSKIKISLPSISEQKKITDFLTSIDKVIESKQQQITQAEQWKTGLMQGLFV